MFSFIASIHVIAWVIETLMGCTLKETGMKSLHILHTTLSLEIISLSSVELSRESALRQIRVQDNVNNAGLIKAVSKIRCGYTELVKN